MKIKTKYYFPEKGKYQVADQYMILRDRHIVGLGNHADQKESKKQFYYDDTNYSIIYGPEEKKYKVVINRLITEADYTTTQKEYLTRLTWLQKQKLLWMFRRHWLQQPGTMMHLLIVSLMLTLALVGYEMINNHF